MILTRTVLFIAFIVLYSNFVSAQGKNSIELTINQSAKVHSLLVPKGIIPLNSKLKVYINNTLVSAKISYSLLWPKSRDFTQSIRVLNIVLFEVSLSDKFKIQWDEANKNITESTFGVKLRGELVLSNIDWNRQALLLTDDNSVDDEWYRHIQALTATYLADEQALQKNKYPKTVASQWLYDRAQAFYQLYLATNDIQWKKHADRFVNYYGGEINDKGFFQLAKPKDVKYLMGRSLVYSFLLNHDLSSLDTLKRMYQASLTWKNYYKGKGFWTERHHAAAINVALSYWEITGNEEALQRVDALISNLVDMTFFPQNDWQPRSCPQHSFRAHEGWGDDSPACSPWMMALLADSLWRYYLLTEDESAGRLLSAFSSFVTNNGIYFGKNRLKGYIIPKYIVSLDNPKQEELEPYSDVQHTCDVAAMVGKGVYIKTLIKEGHSSEKQLFKVMSEQCKKGMLGIVEKYKYKQITRLRIKPPRKFNWQYSSTDDLPWLMNVLNNR